MDWLWITCGLIFAWVTLRVIGGERGRRLETLHATLAANPPPPVPAPAADPKSAIPPVRSKAAR
jgi:hypothetical protein